MLVTNILLYTLNSMPEDSWVAVAPEFANNTMSTQIRKPTTAYQYFCKEHSESAKAELQGAFDIAAYGRLLKEKFNSCTNRERYEQMARQDALRYQHEMHQADVAALQRTEQLQQERQQILLDTDGGHQRTTRKALLKKIKTKKKKNKKQKGKPKAHADDREFVDDDDDSSEGSWDDDDSSSSSQEQKDKPKKQRSQKQIEQRARTQKAKAEKEAYIESRQSDLRKERSSQAKRRLDFLLQQSNIFQHFGNVQQDAAKYGVKTGKTNRHDNEEDESAALEEADEHEATFLSQQPSTLAFGKMRSYQLEGLNWMVRLQENGVNGILADEVSQS